MLAIYKLPHKIFLNLILIFQEFCLEYGNLLHHLKFVTGHWVLWMRQHSTHIPFENTVNLISSLSSTNSPVELLIHLIKNSTIIRFKAQKKF